VNIVPAFFLAYVLPKLWKGFELEERTCYYCQETFLKQKRNKSFRSCLCSRQCYRLHLAFLEILRDFQNGKAKGYVFADLRRLFEEERDELHFFKGDIRSEDDR
jgi:hypothetical protein